MNTFYKRGRRPTTIALWIALAVSLLLMATSARAFDAPVQVFYITEPENDVLPAMDIINSAAVSPMVTKISIAISANGTLVYYDHWEDGFANDIANPTAGEIYANPGNLDGVQIWGDGNTANGAPPGFPGDLLNSGNVIILEDNSVAVPNTAATIDWDGMDKIGATNAVAVSRSLWASGSNSLFAWANAMYPTTEWGYEYTAPVGCNTSASDMFQYTAFSITAAYDGTTIQVDPEGDGSWETGVSLDEGETYFDDSSSGVGCNYIRQGGKVRSTDPAKPIQVVLLTGDIGSNYASRDINLFPDSQLTSSYWIPVGNNTNAGATRLFVYNPSATTLYVKCEKPGSSSVLTIAAGAVDSSFTLNDDQAAHCYAVTSAAGTTTWPLLCFRSVMRGSSCASAERTSASWVERRSRSSRAPRSSTGTGPNASSATRASRCRASCGNASFARSSLSRSRPSSPCAPSNSARSARARARAACCRSQASGR